MARQRLFKKYKVYPFNDRDPIIAKTMALVNGLKVRQISDTTGVPTGTIYRFRKHTKRPQFATVARIGGAVGKKLDWK
jgi:hypothetical protein